jgi:Mn2+/Fe2+ NRAMP family transporter
MGAITGKGLSDLIREEFGLRMTFFTMIVLGLADFGNIAAEFAGLASGIKLFGVNPYIAVPLGAALVWTVIVRGSYKPVERSCCSFLADLLRLSRIGLSRQAGLETGHSRHDRSAVQLRSGYLVMIVGLIGTTITPWMQFYLQASIVEKGVSKRDYG